MADLFAELKRRRVFRAAAVYGLVGITVVQVASAIIPALDIPEWATSLVVLLVLLGFPIALVLAWAYDLTPVGVVRTADDAENGTPPVELPRVRWARWSVPVAFGVAGFTYLLWAPPFGVPEGAPPDTLRYLDSLAVIPFDNSTGLPQYDQLGLGIADQVITEFSRYRPLKVIGRYSVQVLAEAGLTPGEMADSLGVRHILTASYLVAGDRVRVTVQHIDAFTDAVLWSEPFTGPLANLVEAQDRIARQIVDRVLERLPALPRASWGVERQAGAAQLSYQLGSQWLGRRTPEGMQRAIEYFRQAIAEEPTYAQAFADLSSVYALALTYRYDLGLDSYVMGRQALDMAEQAVALDPEGAAGYAARGYIRALLNAPVADVAADFTRAADLQPNSPSVASWSGRALELSGRLDEALAETERAAQLDPLSAGRQLAVAYLSIHLGLYDKAVEFARRGTELEPELMLGRAIEARALLLKGDAAYCAAMELGPHAALTATCLWDLGRVAEAQAIVDSVTAAVTVGNRMGAFTNAVRLEDLAVFYAWTGDEDRALEWVVRAYDASPTAIDVRVYRSALFGRVRNPRFEASVDDIRARLYQRSRRAPLLAP